MTDDSPDGIRSVTSKWNDPTYGGLKKKKSLRGNLRFSLRQSCHVGVVHDSHFVVPRLNLRCPVGIFAEGVRERDGQILADRETGCVVRASEEVTVG